LDLTKRAKGERRPPRSSSNTIRDRCKGNVAYTYFGVFRGRNGYAQN
jgi:hypothetical protein